jgi:hypothetical protein
MSGPLDLPAGYETRFTPEMLTGTQDEGPAAPLIVTAQEFAAIEELGASALVGVDNEALIPEGGDVLFYGDGGAGKTTLTIDLACHLAGAPSGEGCPYRGKRACCS